MTYGSVFDVIKEFDPNSPYIRAYEYYKSTGMYSVRVPSDSFEWVELQNGMATALPTSFMNYQYFRGENDLYPTCESSRSRNCQTEAEKIIADLKVIEFELALKQFPQVYLAEKDGMYINYTALAQHYGFDTNYLDLTNDIGVAAFFACAKFVDGTIIPNPNKEAQIRFVSLVLPDDFFNPGNKLHIFGLQPFLRPSRQCGSCFELEEREDFAKKATTYTFKTNLQESQVIINCFAELNKKIPTGFLWLFPQERIIPVAEEIKQNKCLTDETINLYCTRFSAKREDLIRILDENSVSIIYNPIKWISEAEKAMLEKELTPYPYKGNHIGSRLCYKPGAEENDTF